MLRIRVGNEGRWPRNSVTDIQSPNQHYCAKERASLSETKKRKRKREKTDRIESDIPSEGDFGGGDAACFLGPSGEDTYEDSVDSILLQLLLLLQQPQQWKPLSPSSRNYLFIIRMSDSEREREHGGREEFHVNEATWGLWIEGVESEGVVVEAERREEGEAVLLHIQRDLCLSLSLRCCVACVCVCVWRVSVRVVRCESVWLSLSLVSHLVFYSRLTAHKNIIIFFTHSLTLLSMIRL